MELSSLLIGLVIGLALGFGAAWIWQRKQENQKGEALVRSEQELKTILAQQAHNHVEASKESIEAIRLRLEQLSNNIQTYESSLNIANEEGDKASFFGEHTRVYLNNKPGNANQKITSTRTDAPPRDFANAGSGLFVGNIGEQESANK